jgi:4-hydroxybenzoate polyprenyltransferase
MTPTVESSTFVLMSFIISLFRLTRFWNLLILALCQYCTAGFLISKEFLFDTRLLLLVLSTGLIAAAGYIINDYYDVKIDLINKPDRVVIGKGITRRYAIFFHTALSLIGVGMGFMLNWKIGVINFGCAFLLWLYSNELKRRPFIGNFSVALLTGLSVIIVDFILPTHHLLVLVYALFAFFITLVREIIKDIEDLKGDDTFGCKTLPIIWGLRRTKFFIYVLLILFSGSVLTLNASMTPMPLMFFSWTLFLPLIILTGWLIRADTVRDFYQLSQFCKIIMLAGIASMAFL